MFEKKILNVYAVITGLLFIISGAGKVIDTAAFSNLIYQYGLGYLMILSPVIVITEILIGISLMLLINPRLYSLFAFILLMVFTIAFAYAHFRYGVNDCGCFGTLKHTNISPIFPFLRNSILLLMSLLVFLKYPKEKIETVKWKKNLVQMVMYPAIFIAGFSFTTPFFLQPGIAKHPFQNQNIKNTELSKYIKTSPDSTYLFFCFSYTCPHCWNSIENLRQYKKSNTVDSVIAFATGADSSKLFFIQNFNPDFYIRDLPLDTMLKLTNLFPTSFYVEHDTIKAIIEGELPSHIIFKNQYILPNNYQ